MAKPLIMSIPDRLGKAEALRRLKSDLGSAGASFGHLFSIDEQTWTGDRLAFRVTALGQAVNGSIDVAEDYVRLEVFLPWLFGNACRNVAATYPQGRDIVAGKEVTECPPIQATRVDLVHDPCKEGAVDQALRIVSDLRTASGDLMENPLTLSLWLGVALYAAIGLFGVIIFYDAAPMTQDAAGGYGISIASASAAPQAGK
jgi:hypothetical protein